MTNLKSKVCAAIDANTEQIIEFGRQCMNTPELGYAEHQTSAAVREKLLAAGVRDISTTAITGQKGWIYGKSTSTGTYPSVMVLGELDAVISPLHPQANPQTGAAHSCGHGAQLAALVGTAMGISAISHELDGNVCFAAAPAEEYVQIEERQKLRATGKIAWLGGKQQMIAEGAFDDVDIAIMTHASTGASESTTPHIVTGGTSLGFVGKEIRFTGREAHAAVAPWQGVNALNAATLAIQAIHALRETFQEKDHIRVHPIITKGGDIVNTVPADVRMECFVRAATTEAMQRVNAQVNRAIRGCASALGAEVTINDLPGYYPLQQNAEIGRLFAGNALAADPTALVQDGIPFGGSTDMGDVTWLLPSIQPSVNGFAGTLHGSDFHVADEYLAFVLPAKIMAMTVVDLLENGAAVAQEIIKKSPRRTKEEFAQFWGEIIAI